MKKLPRGVPQNQMSRSWHEGLQNYIGRNPPSSDTPYWDPETQERYSMETNPPEGRLPGRAVTIPPDYEDPRSDQVLRRRDEIPDLDRPRPKTFYDSPEGPVEDQGGIDDGLWHDPDWGHIRPKEFYKFDGQNMNMQPISDRRESAMPPRQNQMMRSEDDYHENTAHNPRDDYVGSSPRPASKIPKNSPNDVPELAAIMDLAENAGYDARAMVEAGDYEGLVRAAKESDYAATDGGIVDIETFSSRLGLGSQYGVDYSQGSRGDDYAFGLRDGEIGGPPYRPNRRPGGIGSR